MCVFLTGGSAAAATLAAARKLPMEATAAGASSSGSVVGASCYATKGPKVGLTYIKEFPLQLIHIIACMGHRIDFV